MLVFNIVKVIVNYNCKIKHNYNPAYCRSLTHIHRYCTNHLTEYKSFFFSVSFENFYSHVETLFLLVVICKLKRPMIVAIGVLIVQYMQWDETSVYTISSEWPFCLVASHDKPGLLRYWEPLSHSYVDSGWIGPQCTLVVA